MSQDRTPIVAFHRLIPGIPAPERADRSALGGLPTRAFRYCDASGDTHEAANVNGSLNHIAGIYSERRNVLGMMPHPENLIEAAHGGTDGRGLFAAVLGVAA